jgi:hypothetical protein
MDQRRGPYQPLMRMLFVSLAESPQENLWPGESGLNMEDKIKPRTGRDPQRRRHREICEVPAAGLVRPRGADG